MLKALAGFLATWSTWLVFNALFDILRSFGAHTFRPHRIRGIESLLPGTVPSLALQQTLYLRDLRWLDYTGYLLHGFWFGLPFAFGLILMIRDRQRLMEFLGWTLVLFYISAVVFILFPVRPPWMEPDIQRIIVVRGFGDYTSLDNNPYAAFPSLHAALPAAMALFFFLRCPSLRFCGWLAAAFALAIGFAVIYLGEHWLIDVLAGYALAGFVAVLFTNKRLRTLYARIPGDPIAKLTRLNNWFYPAPEAPITASLDSPIELDRAA